MTSYSLSNNGGTWVVDRNGNANSAVYLKSAYAIVNVASLSFSSSNLTIAVWVHYLQINNADGADIFSVTSNSGGTLRLTIGQYGLTYTIVTTATYTLSPPSYYTNFILGEVMIYLLTLRSKLM
jgi:hypothetical protein